MASLCTCARVWPRHHETTYGLARLGTDIDGTASKHTKADGPSVEDHNKRTPVNIARLH